MPRHGLHLMSGEAVIRVIHGIFDVELGWGVETRRAIASCRTRRGGGRPRLAFEVGPFKLGLGLGLGLPCARSGLGPSPPEAATGAGPGYSVEVSRCECAVCEVPCVLGRAWAIYCLPLFILASRAFAACGERAETIQQALGWSSQEASVSLHSGV